MKLINWLKKNPETLIVALILLVAAFLRLYRIADYMTFLGDEGRDVLVVYNILHGHLTLLGPTASVGGFFLGPIYYYFMAPFLWLFNYDPVGPAVMVALIGILTVFLIYKVGAEFFNKKTGILAAFIYSISPLVIAYSRSSWNPNPLPFFSLLTLYTLYKAITKNKLLLFFITGILFGIDMQLHYLATFLGVIMGVYVLTSRFFQGTNLTKTIIRIIKDYVLIFLGFVVGWSPFLAFEVRHGFLDFKSIFNFIFKSGETGGNSNFFSIVSDVFFRLFGRLTMAFPPPEQFNWFDKQLLSAWYFFVLVLAISSSILIVYNLYKAIKNRDSKFSVYSLLFLWLFFGVLLFGLYKKSIYDYYFTFMFPLPFFLLSNFLVSVHQVKNKFSIILKLLVIALIFVISFLNLQGLPFRYEPNRQLNQMRTIADFVMTKTNAKPFNFALISSGNSDYAYRYFFKVWGHDPVTILNKADDPQRNSVTDQLLVVCESFPCQPLGNSLWEIAGFGRADIEGHWKVSVVEVYKLVHYKGK